MTDCLTWSVQYSPDCQPGFWHLSPVQVCSQRACGARWRLCYFQTDRLIAGNATDSTWHLNLHFILSFCVLTAFFLQLIKSFPQKTMVSIVSVYEQLWVLPVWSCVSLFLDISLESKCLFSFFFFLPCYRVCALISLLANWVTYRYVFVARIGFGTWWFGIWWLPYIGLNIGWFGRIRFVF